MTINLPVYPPISSPQFESIGYPLERIIPTDLPDVRLWLDAADRATVPGTTIGIWYDKSGLGNNAVQVTGTKQPTYTASGIRGLPALRGMADGLTANVLQVADSSSLKYTTFEAFAVIQRSADTGANGRLFGKYTTAGNQREWTMYYATGAGALGGGTSVDGTALVGSFNSAPALSTGTPYIVGYRYDGTNQISSVNGVDTDTDAQTGVFNGTATIDLFGREALPAEPFNGMIGEAIFYGRSLSVAERSAMISYLKDKWNV